MRKSLDGISKVVLLITDQQIKPSQRTNQLVNTITEIRGYNTIFVGVNKSVPTKDLIFSSLPSNQFYSSSYSRLNILKVDLSKTICQQPIRVRENSETSIISNVDRDRYKYFKYSVKLTNDEFSIELRLIRGLSELYYSFYDNIPKNSSEYITDSDIMQNTVPRLSYNSNIKLYNVFNINKKDTLFFSVKGIDENNEFQIYIHDRIVSENTKTTDDFLFNGQPAKEHSKFLTALTLGALIALFFY